MECKAYADFQGGTSGGQRSSIGRHELTDGQIRHIRPNMTDRPSITQELATAI